MAIVIRLALGKVRQRPCGFMTMVVGDGRAGSAISLVVPDTRPGICDGSWRGCWRAAADSPSSRGCQGKTGASRAIYRPPSRSRSAWV